MSASKKTNAVAASTKAAPGPRASRAIRQGQDKHDGLPLRPFLTLKDDEDGTPQLASAHSDEGGHSAWLLSTLGTASPSFLTQQLNALEVATAGTANTGPNVGGINAALALIAAIDPQDELEGALATQMAGCHALSMAMLCRAKSTSRIDQLQTYGSLAVKMQRTFTTQIEALARLRGKGQQTVRVEHVTVAPGAQAVIGDVHHHQGGGTSQETETQPHAARPTGAGAALPCPDPLAHGVPIPGDAERPLPHARRRVPGRTARQPKRP